MKTYIYRLTLSHSGKEVHFRTCQPRWKLALEAIRSHVATMGREVSSYQPIGMESPQMAKKV